MEGECANTQWRELWTDTLTPAGEQEQREREVAALRRLGEFVDEALPESDFEITGAQPPLSLSFRDEDEIENSSEKSSSPLVPTEQEKYMEREGLVHTRHNGLPRPEFGLKRPRQVERPNLAELLGESGLEPEEQLKLCMAYSTHLRAIIGKRPKTPGAPRKIKK